MPPFGLRIQTDDRDVPWRATSVPGVHWLLLHSEERAGGAGAGRGGTVLIRMEPGRGYPPHRHLGGEEVLVLQGGYRDEAGSYVTGEHVHYDAGSSHAPVALGDPDRPAGPDNPACVLFAVAHGGIEVLEEGG